MTEYGEISSTVHRQRMIELVVKIRLGQFKTADECHALVDELVIGILDPSIIDDVFNSDDGKTPEEVIDKALSYKPFVGDWRE